MNFKKRSEMCKPGEQRVGTVCSRDISGGTVFSGVPCGWGGGGIFYKLSGVCGGGFARLTYYSGEHCEGFRFDDREIEDYKALNVTMVDEDA